MALLSPFMSKQLQHQEAIYTALRKNEITFSKTEAAKIVGSRGKLERLVFSGKIRMTKPNSSQFGRWFCMAEDVLRYADDII